MATLNLPSSTSGIWRSCALAMGATLAPMALPSSAPATAMRASLPRGRVLMRYVPPDASSGEPPAPGTMSTIRQSAACHGVRFGNSRGCAWGAAQWPAYSATAVPQRSSEEAMAAIADAGRPARPDELVDLDALATAYYARRPDVAEPGQRVAFGTSGHRGSSLDGVLQRGPHRGHHGRHLRLPPRAGHARAAVHGPRHARPLRAGLPDGPRGAGGRRASTCASTAPTASRRPRPSRTPS